MTTTDSETQSINQTNKQTKTLRPAELWYIHHVGGYGSKPFMRLGCQLTDFVGYDEYF
jgi:hypothetical protein